MADNDSSTLAARLERLKQRAAAAGASTSQQTANHKPLMTTHLRPNQNRDGDFFVADILDVAPKDDAASMEHPLFALRAGDKRVRTYKRKVAVYKYSPRVWLRHDSRQGFVDLCDFAAYRGQKSRP